MKRSGIAWTDYSGGNLNFVRRGKAGDCEVSEGCRGCYALRVGERFGNLPETTTVYPEKIAKLWLQNFPRVDGRDPRCFVCDTGDIFHPNVSEHWLTEAFGMMNYRRDVIWQVLTKRPERMKDFIRRWVANPPVDRRQIVDGMVPSHIWLGVTAENQAMADERIPLLLQTPAALRFVSVEPMLEGVDLDEWIWGNRCPDPECGDSTWDHYCRLGDQRTHWVICGGESGPAARPMHPDWVRSLRDQCVAAGVPFFFKQWGEWAPWIASGQHAGGADVMWFKDRQCMAKVGVRQAGRLLDGREWLEFPEMVGDELTTER
jgi:protein gp37